MFLKKKGGRISYSQAGEDLIIKRFFKNQNEGFYVDVGANDPINLSNTYLFYKDGWTGINIEPEPSCFEKLQKKRPRDINLHQGIGTKLNALDFYRFKQNVRSTFSKETANRYKQEYDFVGVEKITTTPLYSTLEQYAKGKTIDILSIDTEGTDMDVLKSNDWTKYRPKFIILETSHKDEVGNRIKNSATFSQYLKQHNYVPFAETFVNTIYISQEFSDSLKIVRKQ